MRASKSLGLAALAMALAATPAAPQSDILLQLRSGSPAGDRFRVDSAGGVVALGQIGVGIIPASGAGWRMMWYPYKVAFRAGYADAGGQFDDANIGFYSWAGGALSTAAGIYSFAMGNQNTVEADAQCGMALGSGNKVWGSGSDVTTCGVAIGLNNHAKDGTAAVAIGNSSTASASYSMAFGYRANTNARTGAIVFSDQSSTDSVKASANNEFSVRAAGGIRMRTNSAFTTGCVLGAGGGAAGWSCSSSRAMKRDPVPVDGEALLARIRALPLNTWSWIDNPQSGRHMGLFSEDFHAAFSLGTDTTSIGHQDMDGVNFGGVKALEERTDALRRANEALTGTIGEMRAEVRGMAEQLAELKARNEALERAVLELTARQAAPRR